MKYWLKKPEKIKDETDRKQSEDVNLKLIEEAEKSNKIKEEARIKRME